MKGTITVGRDSGRFSKTGSLPAVNCSQKPSVIEMNLAKPAMPANSWTFTYDSSESELRRPLRTISTTPLLAPAQSYPDYESIIAGVRQAERAEYGL